MKVRIVEDEKDTWRVLQLNLEWEGFLIAPDVDEGMLLTEPTWEGIDAAVVDIGLATISGLDVVAYLNENHPDVRVVVLTGDETARRKVETAFPNARFLMKPMNIEEVTKALSDE